MGEQSDTTPVREPLKWRVALESTASRSELVLSHGDASATFSWQRNPRQQDAVLPRWGGHLFAPSNSSGAAFVERVADWLGAESPASPDTPGVPAGLHYSVERLRKSGASDKDGWTAYRVSTGESRRLSLVIRIDEANEHAEMLATEATRPRSLVDSLAIALRDGPGRASLPEGWTVREPPLVTDVRRLYHGQYLNCVHTDGGIVGSRRDGQSSSFYRWPEVGAAGVELTTVDGVVSALAGTPARSTIAAIVVHPSNPRGLGTSDPAGLMQVDSVSGRTRKILSPGIVDPFGALAWAPNGRFLAVELAGKRIGVVDVEAGRVIEKVPVVGGELLRWDARGIWVRVRKRDPSGWFEAHLWNPETNALEAVSPTRSMSPDGTFDVRRDQGVIVITDAGGAERTLEHHESGTNAARPGFPGAWLDESRIVLEGEEPLVLDARDLSMRYLLPRGRIRGFSVSEGLVIFAPRQGERWCGQLDL